MWFLEFASPWMAPWLAAAAIPIAIHFLHRRKQQTLSWAAIELLLHIVQKQSRRMQFEQWLLLLLRTAVLVLFALAIMRPWRHLPTSSNAAESEAASSQLHIIVLDASYSMLAKETESSRWESAVRAAVRIIRERSLGEAVQLIRMAQRAESVNGEPSFEHERMILETERLECSAGPGDLTGALDLIDRTVRTARSTGAWPQSIHVHFLTDLENETWRTWSDQQFLQRWKAMAESVDEVHVESFASLTGGNVGIVEVKTDQRAALPGRPLRVTALVQNNTPKPIQLPIQFQTGGNTIRSESVSAAAGETAAVSVELIPPDAPFWALTAEIPTDRLPIDDRRHLVIPVRRQIRVACVEDEKNSAQMAALALSPGTGSGSSGNRRDPFAVETLTQFELNGSRLVNSDAVVLCDIRKLTAKQIETLTAFAARGGAIIALLNRECDAIDWNREEQGAAGLFGFKLIRPSEDADYAPTRCNTVHRSPLPLKPIPNRDY
ncbi:MAG: BatA domain-containing protein [Pirellulales bacterium]